MRISIEIAHTADLGIRKDFDLYRCLGLFRTLPLKRRLQFKMTTTFTSLPVVDLAPLASPCPSSEALKFLATRLCNVFETTGFAYLINAPLTFSHDEVFGMAKEFFSIPEKQKMATARRTFERQNKNTYRGFFQ